MTLTWQKVLLIVAFVLVGLAGAILATWVDWPHPAAFLAFGAAAWLGSQLQMWGILIFLLCVFIAILIIKAIIGALRQMGDRTTVEVYEAKDGWRWRMKAGNGEIIADSAEAYATKSNAERAVTRAFGPDEQVAGMSYVRWGIDGSHVYVFVTEGAIECCACDEPGNHARSTDEMVAHLRAHRERGDCVPDFVFEDLVADTAQLDSYLQTGVLPDQFPSDFHS